MTPQDAPEPEVLSVLAPFVAALVRDAEQRERERIAALLRRIDGSLSTEAKVSAILDGSR